MNAIIFDCDGVLADTERYGHLPAFNRTFAEFGLPVTWSEEEYGRRLLIGGGKERMASLLTDEFVREAGLPDDPEALRAEVARWHARKTELYTEAVAAGSIAARPGIRRLMQETIGAGWVIAVASTSAEVSVRAILDHVAGEDAVHVGVVVAGDAVVRKKPAPDVYDLAIERLGVDRTAVVAIEDSRNGLLAAVGAGAACLVTVNDYTRHEDFAEAPLVVDNLGDPGQPPIAVLENRTTAEPGAWITLEDVRACLRP